jgi:hypothetical protein
MHQKLKIYLSISVIMITLLACSLSGIQQSASSAKQTSEALKTDVSGIVAQGGALLNTAQALETQHPGIIGTVKAISTQGAPILSTIQAAGTYSPGLVQTAQAVIQNEIPTGEPPSDIPILNRDQVKDYFGSSQYVFYISPSAYADVMQFYQTEMPNNGWQYIESESHEYANAAHLVYTKDNLTATIDISANPLNNTTVIVINLHTN